MAASTALVRSPHPAPTPRPPLARLRLTTYGLVAAFAALVGTLLWSLAEAGRFESLHAESVQALVAELSAAGLEEAALAAAAALAVLVLSTLWLTETLARVLRQQHRRHAGQRAELRRLALVAERTRAVVVVTDREDRIVWVNDAFAQLSGWSLDEARGRSRAELMHSPQVDEPTAVAVREALTRGEGLRTDLPHRTRDGREVWLDVDIQPVHGEDGALEGFVSVGTDITEQRRSASTDALTGLANRSVLLERTRGIEDAMVAAQRVLQALAAPYAVGAQGVQGGVSIGVVTSELAAATAEEVLRDADTAMYEAKRGGRGRCVLFDASMRERRAAAQAMERDLRRALRDGELALLYQPVVDLTSDTLVGVEALLRWHHPHRGLVAAEPTIRAAEEAGLSEELGEFVIGCALHDFRGWQQRFGERAPGFLTLNLSRGQLMQPGLAGRVRHLLDAHGVEASRLQLEVPERLAGEGDAVNAALRLLRQLGVRLTLDNFGTGHSSLASLHRLPVETIKIDRSLVAQAQTVEHHRVLIEATIRVARTLGLRTVAEGVETESQAALMQALDCEHGQGWLYAQPMDAGAFERWMGERRELLAA